MATIETLGQVPRSILIVEDDRSFGSALAAVVERVGLEPLVSERGDVALAMAAQYQPAAVLMDVRLPGLDGWGTLDRLLHAPATSHIPIGVITGDPRRDYALRLGACAYVQKPASLEVVEQMVRTLHGRAARAERRVAILDPRPAWRDELRVEIDALGCETITIDCAEAAARDAWASIDLVVTDGAAPDDPSKLCRRIDAVAGRPDLPVLALSTSTKQAPWVESATPGALGGAFVLFVRDRDQLLHQAAARLHRRASALRNEHRSRIAALRRADPALQGATVMVVDDDPRNIMAMTALLNERRMEVVAAQSGPIALELLTQRSDIDAVLMDIMMPTMDGYETIRAIRARRGHETLPIVALTAKAMAGDREACLAAGASDYVPKPVDADQLLSRLRLCLTR